MTQNELQSLFATALANGCTIGRGTSYSSFSGDGGIPTEGEDVILATAMDTIKVEPSSVSTNLVVYYKTQSGRWISKNSLFGKHYLDKPNGAALVKDMQCRTEFVSEPVHKTEDLIIDGNKVTVYCFTSDVKVKYGKKDKVYLPVQVDAYNYATRTMNVTREAENYATLTVG